MVVVVVVMMMIMILMILIYIIFIYHHNYHYHYNTGIGNKLFTKPQGERALGLCLGVDTTGYNGIRSPIDHYR